MLKGVSKLISPELLKILAEMGHGDEIVIGDANFPAVNYGKRVVRADGIGGTALLSALLDLIPLDSYAEENFLLMEVVKGGQRCSSDLGGLQVRCGGKRAEYANRISGTLCFLRTREKCFCGDCVRRRANLCEYNIKKRSD